MSRRVFSMAALGIGAATQSAFSQAPRWSQFKPLSGSLKEKMHKGELVRTVPAPSLTTHTEVHGVMVSLLYLFAENLGAFGGAG